MRSAEHGGPAPLPRRLTTVAALALFWACAGQTGTPATDADPLSLEPDEVELTEEDFYGTYDLYMGGAQYEAGAATAPLTAEWSADEFVVLQNGNQVIRTDIAIDPGEKEIRLWDETTSDVLCSSEGVYTYEDDGTTISMTLESDPCSGRAESADGARLVRR